ncbi:AAA family ATPase [Bradyrhizobium sp.]|uniref:AAA family ATPase n=1 Tax=Bradyrhizobium sp. TaxID=376 RepID=UPI003BB20CB2
MTEAEASALRIFDELGTKEQPTKDIMTETTEGDTFPPDRSPTKLRMLPPSRGYPFKTFDEMSGETAAKNWLVKGVLAKGETSAWIAPPGGMKSALLAQASICVAGGLDWQGKRNKGAAGVVYFALARADLVEKRIKAHCLRLGLKSLPIAVVAVTFDLIKPDSVKRVITTIQEAEAVFGIGAGLVIFDTFAKLIAAGGGDENQAKDQGAVFANVQRIKNATCSHVAIIGHTGKDVQKGARGSNAILGDVDVMVEISGDIVRTATVTKANDMPEGPLFSFKSEIHEFGIDEDGDPISVNVVSDDAVSVQTPPKEQQPKATAQRQNRVRYPARCWGGRISSGGLE